MWWVNCVIGKCAIARFLRQLKIDLIDRFAVAVILFAGLTYIAASRGDLWFDEVLSLQWAKNAKTSWELITLYKHDNNHILNSFWIQIVGIDSHPILLRGLSILAGIGSLITFYLLTRKIFGVSQTALILLILFGFSYASVLYFSEARGYGMGIFCSLAALFILFLCSDRGWGWIICFWVICLVGLFSHATVIYPISGLGIWLMVKYFREGEHYSRVFLRLAKWFGIPFLGFCGLFLGFWREMIIAGGPESEFWNVLAEYFSYCLGMPSIFPFPEVSIGLGIILVGIGWIKGPWKLEDRILFLAIPFLIGFGLLIKDPDYIAFRYFLTTVPLTFFLLGGFLDGIKRKFGWVRWIICLGLLVQQIPKVGELIIFGRGNPSACVVDLDKAGDGNVISNHEMLVGMVFEHYLRKSENSSKLRYFPSWSSFESVADWVIISRQGGQKISDREDEIEVLGKSYIFWREYVSAPVSGSNWLVYRRRTGS